MGACGCGDFRGGLRFPGPDGIVYVLEVYPGCADCDAPAGIKINRHRDVEDQRFWFENEEPMAFLDFKGEPASDTEEVAWFHQRIVDPDLVLKAIDDRFGGIKCLLDDDPEPTTIREMLKFESDEWREAIDAGIDATLAAPWVPHVGQSVVLKNGSDAGIVAEVRGDRVKFEGGGVWWHVDQLGPLATPLEERSTRTGEP